MQLWDRLRGRALATSAEPAETISTSGAVRLLIIHLSAVITATRKTLGLGPMGNLPADMSHGFERVFDNYRAGCQPKYTNEALAEAVGCEVDTVSRWRNGHQRPTRYTAKIADALSKRTNFDASSIQNHLEKTASVEHCRAVIGDGVSDSDFTEWLHDIPILVNHLIDALENREDWHAPGLFYCGPNDPATRDAIAAAAPRLTNSRWRQALLAYANDPAYLAAP